MNQMGVWEELMTKPLGTIGQLVTGALGGMMIAVMVSLAVFM
jgi:hypothetical protein